MFGLMEMPHRSSYGECTVRPRDFDNGKNNLYGIDGNRTDAEGNSSFDYDR